MIMKYKLANDPLTINKSIKVEILKLTDESLLKEACEFTMLKEIKSRQTFSNMLNIQHSPIRTQIYIVKMYNIPAFVAHHFRTHTVGIMGHWITSRRDDRGGEAAETRSEPVNHMFIANAEALINMARQRLCIIDVHPKTREVMVEIVHQISLKEQFLANHMISECDYAKKCISMKPCGKYPTPTHKRGLII